MNYCEKNEVVYRLYSENKVYVLDNLIDQQAAYKMLEASQWYLETEMVPEGLVEDIAGRHIGVIERVSTRVYENGSEKEYIERKFPLDMTIIAGHEEETSYFSIDMRF